MLFSLKIVGVLWIISTRLNNLAAFIFNIESSRWNFFDSHIGRQSASRSHRFKYLALEKLNARSILYFEISSIETFYQRFLFTLWTFAHQITRLVEIWNLEWILQINLFQVTNFSITMYTHNSVFDFKKVPLKMAHPCYNILFQIPPELYGSVH